MCGTALPVEGTCSAPHEDLESARAEAQRTVAEALPGAGAASGTPAADPTGARGGAGVGAAPAPLRRETSEDRHSAGDLAGANDGVGAAEVAAALESLAFLADAHGGGFDPYEGAGTSDGALMRGPRSARPRRTNAVAAHVLRHSFAQLRLLATLK